MTPPKRPAQSPLDEELARRSAQAATQPRNPLGTFAPIPAPPPLATRRNEVLAAGDYWMPTEEEWEEFSARVWAARHFGVSAPAMSAAWGVPVHTIRRAIAHARSKVVESREDMKAWIVSFLEGLAEAAERDGDKDVARKAAMDLAKLYGWVSTGGNTPGVQINNNLVAPGELGTAITAWIDRQKALEAPKTVDGEIVPDDTEVRPPDPGGSA